MFFYGQAYLGSFGTWAMAPLYGLWRANYVGVLAVHAVWYALGAPVLYRVLFELGGRWGAAVGVLALGLGSRDLHDTTAMLNYYEMFPLAARLYLRLARAPDRGMSDRCAPRVGRRVRLLAQSAVCRARRRVARRARGDEPVAPRAR